MSLSVSGLAHGVAQGGTAWLVGKGSDYLFNKVNVANKYPIVRVVGQFSVGMVVLGEVMRGLGGSYLLGSPIGDGLLMVWFYQPQKGLWAAVDQVVDNVEAAL
jgi:hypothetical protein